MFGTGCKTDKHMVWLEQRNIILAMLGSHLDSSQALCVVRDKLPIYVLEQSMIILELAF